MDYPPIEEVDHDKPCPECGGKTVKDTFLRTGNEWVCCISRSCGHVYCIKVVTEREGEG